MKQTNLSLVILLLATAQCVASSVGICSFNVQFLGSSSKRENAALATLVKNYDIVVVQELIAPPYPGHFPDGTALKPDREAALFFEEMKKWGFTYAMSEEDTGTNDKIHVNSTATEWWVTFFKTNAVKLAPDIPTGFLASDRSNHPDYERVPFAFGFRTVDHRMDFVLISVHLQPDASPRSKARRKHELAAIADWIKTRNTREKDFIILGDMNIENLTELASATPPGFASLNKGCLPTNTNVNGRKPYDHVMYTTNSAEIDSAYGFKVVDLVESMRPYWKRNFPSKKYPGDAPYRHDAFRMAYSDHHPVEFRLKPLSSGDDD